jgi:hypothetical protein
MREKKRKQKQLNDLPFHMRGPAQNRWGGHRTQNLKTFAGNTFGAASDCIVFTEEQKQAWMKSRITPLHG